MITVVQNRRFFRAAGAGGLERTCPGPVRFLRVALRVSFVWMIAIQSVWSQKSYRSVQQIEEQWKKVTSFQKEELISFCDFLFHEGYYERAILASFRFIFLYPGDESVPLVYYRIARSYEETGNFDLAIEYYRRVQADVESNSSEYISAQYRITYLHLLKGDHDQVYKMAGESADPYLTVFKGYAKLAELEWVDARESFLKAGKLFRSRDHNRILRRLIRACERASALPSRSPLNAGLFGLLPGGGRAYLGEWVPAVGTILSTVGLGLQLAGAGSSSPSVWIPGGALVAVYGGSIVGSVWDVEYANRELMKRYARGIRAKLGPENFLDFAEPHYLSTQ